jgi:hypothetical protein
MSAIPPPLDFIPKLPAKAVSEIMSQLERLIDSLSTNVNKTVTESVKLPVTVQCDDPRVTQIKKQLMLFFRDYL